MKRLSMLALCTGLLVFAGSSSAAFIATTWTDTYDPVDQLLIAGTSTGTYTYTHDITDNGFDPGRDLVWDYDISISLYDDRGSAGDPDSARETAIIDLPGVLTDQRYNFSLDYNTFGASIIGWAFLNFTGMLDVTITAERGDFYFADSMLRATGFESDPAPVPEPGTLFLLGAGLAGLGGIRYRRKRT